jgi:signal transduction histidine kinase
LRNLLLGFIPVVIAIASLGGAWLSRRALRPVQDISRAAINIGIENLSQRLPLPSTGDELAHLSQVLNTMFERLESAVKSLSQFAADASHELRTPLAIIQTTADLALRRGRTPESYRESLLEITQEARRMTGIVEDLLELARGDAAVLDLPFAPLDLRDLLADLYLETKTLAQARGIDVKLRPGAEPAILPGNRPALRRLFLALLDNALKYSPSGGEVILAIERHDAPAEGSVDNGARRPVSNIAVTVRDFGPGISPSDLPHIFKRFYRADREASGHGLGLALAENLARAHGATIVVESPAGGGALFRVLFDARESRKPAARPPADHEVRPTNA